MDPLVLSGVGSILGGLGGIFGSKPKPPKQLRPADVIKSNARGAREASDQYGFNPLTLLQYGSNSGATLGGGGGSTPPLASIDLITGGLKDIADVTSGDAARRRAADQVEIDLAKLRLDQARSGVATIPGPVAYGVGSGPSPLGGRPATVSTVGGAKHSRPFSMGENPVAPGRKDDIAPLTNSPGVFEIENRVTGGQPVTIPGEGEPWGIDELATGAVFAVPQILGNLANGLAYGGKSYAERMADYRKREKAEPKKKPAKKIYDGLGGPVYDFKY